MSKTIILTHEQIKNCFSEVYNEFYLKWRLRENHERTDEEIENMINEADALREQFNQCTLVNSMLDALIEQFTSEERQMKKQKGGE